MMKKHHHQQHNNNLPIGQNKMEEGVNGIKPVHEEISENDTWKSRQLKYGIEINFYTCMDWQSTSLLLDMRLMYVCVFYCPVPIEPEIIN